MFFWSISLKMHKKRYCLSKTPFWPFLAVNNGFFAFSKILNQITFVRQLFLKLKKEKYEDNFFQVFISELKNALFRGSTKYFFFLSVLAFKTIGTQMLFWSVFLKTHKNGQNGVFDGQ